MARKGNTDQTHAGKRKPYQFMSRFDILGADGSLYLRRWRLIQTPAFALYLHKIVRPDSDHFVHDHPWTFLSIILKGGYTEMRRDNFTHEIHPRVIRHVNLKHRDDAHYISTLKDGEPCWSFLLVGRRRRTWGFWTPLSMHDPNAVPSQVWTEFDNWTGR